MFITRKRPSVAPPLLARPLPASLLLCLFALLLRAPAFTASVIDPDEGLYLLQARAWLDGGWPFLAVWDMHPLGAPALLLPALALIADPIIAMRLTGVAAVAASAMLLRALAPRFGAGPGAALAAGLLYIAHSTVLGGLATNTEILFAPFVLLAALLLLRGRPGVAVTFAAGLAAGIGLLVKQIVFLEASALWLAMIALAWPLKPARLAALALAYALGAGLPSGLVALGYWLAGAIEPWLWANLWAPLGYGIDAGDAPGARRGIVQALPHLAWLSLAAAGLALGDWRGRWPILLWLGAAALAVAAPGKWHDHYFLVLLPPLCLLAALGLAAALAAAARPGWRRGALAVLTLALAAMPLSAMMAPRLARGMGISLADPPRQVAALVRAQLPPGQALYVANWHAVAYVLAGQPPPTRYAFPGHLAGHYHLLTGIDADAELARVLALPPGIIVIDPARWRHSRPEARAAIEAALAARYTLLARVPDGGGAVEVWRLR